MSWIKTWRTWHGIKYQTLYFDLLTTSITAESCSENENDGRTSPSFTFIHNTFVISLLSVHWVRDKKDETISSRGKGIDLISAAKFCLIFHEKRCASLNLQCQAKYDCVYLTPPLSSPSPPTWRKHLIMLTVKIRHIRWCRFSHIASGEGSIFLYPFKIIEGPCSESVTKPISLLLLPLLHSFTNQKCCSRNKLTDMAITLNFWDALFRFFLNPFPLSELKFVLKRNYKRMIRTCGTYPSKSKLIK